MNTGNTSASDINSSGEIVGSYSNDKAVEGYGFFYTDGIFHTLDYPGKQITNLSGLNDSGQIVGGYQQDNTHPTFAFLYSGGTFTTLLPSVSYTGGINNSGQIVGTVGTMAGLCTNLCGFIDDNGTITPFINPEQPPLRSPTSITVDNMRETM